MATKCKKCDPHEICEECPEWIFTLADLIMCMMGLFVLLWVLKTEGAKAEDKPLSQNEIQHLIGIREAFGWVPDPASNDPIDQAAIRLRAMAPRGGDGENGTQTQEVEGAEGVDPTVTRIRTGPESTVGVPIRFARGAAELSDASRRQLDQLATIIRGHRNVFVVKGHTSLDDLSEESPPDERMALSLRRAQVVASYLQERGVSPDTLRVQGASTFEPVVQRVRGDSMAANRRVEVEASSTLVNQLQDPDQQPARPMR